MKYDSTNGKCVGLQKFLTDNSLLDPYSRPTVDARGLKTLPQKRYEKLEKDVDRWEKKLVGQVVLP